MARKKKPPAREPDALFEGVETDELGIPVDGAEISEEDLEHAPVDSKAARIATEYRKAVSRKAAGDTGVKFNTPDPYKYNGMAKVHPEAKVIILQVDPPDDKIPETTVSHLGDYGMMRAWVRDNFWDSSKTTKYSWAIHSGAYPYATGHLVFQAQPGAYGSRGQEDHMSRYGQQPPPGMPYGVQQPYPGMPPAPSPQPYMQQPYMQQPYMQQPYMQPPPQQVFVQQPPPQQQQPQQQAAPPPPPPPAPMPQMQPPPGMDPVMAMMFQTLMQQLNASREENAQLRMYYQQQPQQFAQQPAPVAPPPPPPPPKSPLEQLREMSSVVSEVSDLTNNMRRKFAPEEIEPPEPTQPLQSDEGFPLKVKDFGAIRAVATEDGKVTMPFFANIDKYEGLLDGFLDKVTKMLDKVGEKRTASIREQVELMERAEGVANRTAAVRGHPQQQQALPPQTQQRPATPVHVGATMGAVAAPSARVQAPSSPQHPWDKFASAPKPAPIVHVMPVEEPPAPPQEPVKEVQVVETTAEVAD
jgi:hypothetical protein